MNNILSSVASITTGNAAPQPSHPVSERQDIHKSCKSLETLLNVLNDYCEAATAVVALQKKLAKALRETASSKVTNETAGNALNASANIFDALAEVDAKFVKIADKEYDAISTEVKKWFKKLAKEEKAHDERIANANAKIKQAGVSFEKKSRKKSMDAQDEHSRYIHLISTLGPEITQEKYNHLLQTTQRHTTTIYSVAACLARIADTEWVRSCECVRRYAPTIGPLGEWRSLCEGGWTKEMPGDLVNLDDKPQDNLRLNTIKERTEVEEEVDLKPHNERPAQPTQDHQNPEHTMPLRYRQFDNEPPASDPQALQPHTYLDSPRSERERTTSTSASYPSQAPSSSSGNSPVLPRYSQNLRHDSTTSLPRATTPTHPPASSTLVAPSGQASRQASLSPAASASASPNIPAQEYPSEREHTNNNLHPPSPASHHPRPRSRDESPTPDDRRFFSDPATGSVRSLSAFPAPPNHFPLPPPRAKDAPPTSTKPSISAIEESKEEQMYAARERMSESPLPLEYAEDHSRGDHSDDPSPPLQQPRVPSGNSDRQQEKPARNATSNTTSASPPISAATPRTHSIQPESYDLDIEKRAVPSEGLWSPTRGRYDRCTSTTGSIVAAMKNRYSNTSDSRSPPPHVGDLPRLHTSVTEIANRYQPPLAQDVGNAQVGARISSGSVTDVRDLREQQSPRIKQSPLRPLTKSPPPAMGRNVSNPTTPEKRAPTTACLFSLTNSHIFTSSFTQSQYEGLLLIHPRIHEHNGVA
ncbi:hypothetical protein NP233_g1929 [Leucocoprinus birnbaumii]|uniref:Uncharacterized protein n=1 Tax=Leucocoprinus birnbaumii TaxID=56174 RepID=A0AAD5YZD2_9AGAR|nr:hypothetical protein NP233_g1929 [Leucocoprinus birnbaumii]